MSTIKEFLTADHRKCDELFADMEEKADKSPQDAIEACREFIFQTEKHFQREERVMFVEFETKTGITEGPTQMMRHEHAQMRNLMKQMLEALEAGDKDKFFGYSETLMILLQQHNMKEEQMLYPMAQQHLSADSDRVVEMMNSMVVE